MQNEFASSHASSQESALEDVTAVEIKRRDRKIRLRLKKMYQNPPKIDPAIRGSFQTDAI